MTDDDITPHEAGSAQGSFPDDIVQACTIDAYGQHTIGRPEGDTTQT